jgi:ribosomal protein L37AE/L43A
MKRGKRITWACSHCAATFKARRLLRAHVAFEHGGLVPGEVITWACSHCGATFPAREALMTHVAVKHRRSAIPAPAGSSPLGNLVPLRQRLGVVVDERRKTA